MNIVISFVTGLYTKFLLLYPRRFREEFAAEMEVVFQESVNDAIREGIIPFVFVCLKELGGLPFSILREFWHELGVRKDVGAEGGGIRALGPAGAPGALWFTGWTLLTTAAIPVALIAAVPLAVMLIWLINQGVNAGFWPTIQDSTLEVPGFLIGFALVPASVHWNSRSQQ